MFIESENNKIIKLVTSLKLKKKRDEENLFVVEGERIVNDAIIKAEPVFIIVSESYKCKDFQFRTYEVSEKLFKKMSQTETPQGILAVFPKLNSKENLNGDVLILNKISDPGNLGTMIRTALATGFNNIIVDDGCVDVYNPKVLRATMSAIFDINIIKSNNLISEIKSLKTHDYTVIATALTSNSESLFSQKLKNKVAVIIGNEANGIDQNILLETTNVIIPMKGNIESLNAGVAGSVVMYEVFRQKECF